MLLEFKRAFRAVLKRKRIETDLDEELRFHIEMESEKNIRRGMDPAEARRLAMRNFGGLQQIKEQVRDLRGVGMIEVLKQDIRYGIRTLINNPGFTIVAILTLALGIGANTAIFSVVNGVLLRPLPYENGHELVLIRQQRPLAGDGNAPFSVHEVNDYRTQNQSLAGVVEYHSMSFILLGRAEPQRVGTGVVSHNFFDVLGVKPILGRNFLPGDEEHGAEAVLLLSHAYWENSFGKDPNIVGRVFEMNDRPHTVVGVLPPVPQYPDENDVYMPTSACPFRSAETFIANRDARMMRVFGRLKPGLSVEQAQADLDTIANRLRQDYPESYPDRAGYKASVLSLEQELTRPIRPTLWILLCTAGFVLLIVCASVANLTVARLLRRERELTVRAAMGASRSRILRQLVTESTILSVAGGGLGLLLASSGLDLLVRFAALFTTRAVEIGIDSSVLVFTLAVSVVTGVTFGAIPALSSRGDLAGSLKDGGARTTSGRARQRLRSALIVAQVAVSFVLLIGAGLMVRSLLKLQEVDAGIDFQNTLTARVDLNFAKYRSQDSRRQMYERLIAEFKTIPGLTSVAGGGVLPLNAQPPSSAFRIEGRAFDPNVPLPRSEFNVVTPGYFATLGVPLLRGRDFALSDTFQAPQVVILNQSMARHHWGQEDPVGHKVSLNEGRSWATIVGVVADTRNRLDAEAGDALYIPLLQNPFLATTFFFKAPGDPKQLSQHVRAAVYKVDPEQPVDNFRTFEEVRAESIASPRLTAILLALFAALALMVTATGIAGVIAFSVGQRTQEIGIRMALGARQSSVLWMVLRQGLLLVGIGLAIGTAGALALTRMMSGLLFGVQPTDSLTFAGVSLILVMIAVAACLLPARRAIAIDPLVALRSE